MIFDYTREPGKKLFDRKLSSYGEPLISIITPYYNAGEYFEQTYNCVMNQTFPWFEWIIVDDGSTDTASIELLDRLSVSDRRVCLVHQANGGLSAARNTGIEKSRTEIIIPLDSDDLIEPVYLEELFFALEKNPEAAWAYTDSVGFEAQEYQWKKHFSATRMKTENLLVCTAAIRKKWILQVNGYKVSKQYFNEDWHLWLRLLAHGAWPVHLSGFHFWYRRKNTSMLQTIKQDEKLQRASLKKIYEAAGKVKDNIVAKEYPIVGDLGKYLVPKVSNWERKTFVTHDKIHVLMLLPWMVMGGADLFNLDICSRLDKKRFEVGIITTQISDNSWQQRFSEHVTDIFNLPDFLDVEDWAEFISYYIKSREVDILFLSNSVYGYYLVPWLRKEFPKLAIIDYVHMEEWYWRNGGHARTSGIMGSVLEKTYVCNESTRQVLINHFKRTPESVKTLYIGVDHEKFKASTVKPGIAKQKLGISEKRPMVLFPCRIQPQKRPFLMVEIAKELKRNFPEVAFVVVGDGDQLNELQIAVKQLGLEKTIYFAGQQSDMRPWYRDSVLTLICSIKEGISLTSYESLSMGKPVVTSDVGGQAELINDNVGRVVPILQDEENDLDNRKFSTEEVTLYVKAITELLSNDEEYKKTCIACRKRIEEGFSSQSMIDQLESIFETLVSDSNVINLRLKTSVTLNNYSHMIGEFATLACEIETYERLLKNTYTVDTKNELLRIANSKWGQRIIKLAFKFKLNRLF